ncbi:hypothetical protein Trydic_g16487 [Trypoxylus dichotomus]
MENGRSEQNYQKDYFESIIRKYECRNAFFTQKQCELRKRLETIESFLPAVMCYNMMQTKDKSVKPTTEEYGNNPVGNKQSRNIRNERTFKNPRNDRNLRSCDCDLCPLNSNCIIKNGSPKTPTTSVTVRSDRNMKSCFCDPCPISKDVPEISKEKLTQNEKLVTTNEANIPLTSNTSNFLKSDDIRCMNRIRKLARTEKRLTKELAELEHKEKTYSETLQQPIDTPGKESGCGDDGNFEFETLKCVNQQLEYDNKLLEEELEQVKNDIKHIHDTIEEPMKQELETEKCKCLNLEEKIQKRSTEITTKKTAQQNKLSFLKRQLQSANQNLHNLHIVNKRLKEELCMLNGKCNELQTDLINQKISEIHTFSRIAASHSKELSTPPFVKPCLPPYKSESGEDLDNIARNLSKLIQDATSCKNCKNRHTDMIDTVRYIKDLVDMVSAGKRIPPITDTESDMFCKCVDWKKLKEEIQLEEPTHEILSPQKIHSVESIPSTTKGIPQPHTPPKKSDRSSVVETAEFEIIPFLEPVATAAGEESIPSSTKEETPLSESPSKKETRRRSAVDFAEDLTNILLHLVLYEDEVGIAPRIGEDYKIQTNEEMAHEEIKDSEVNTETEIIEETTDISVTQNDTDQLLTEASDIAEDGVTTSVNEEEDITDDVTEKEIPNDIISEDKKEAAKEEDMAAVTETAENIDMENYETEEVPEISIPIEESVTEKDTEEPNTEEISKPDEEDVPTEILTSPKEETESIEPTANLEDTVTPEGEENSHKDAVEVNLDTALTTNINLEEEVSNVIESTEIVSDKSTKEVQTNVKSQEDIHLEEGFKDDAVNSSEVISEGVINGILEEIAIPIAEKEEKQTAVSLEQLAKEKMITENEEKEDQSKRSAIPLEPLKQGVEKLEREYDQDDVTPTLKVPVADTVKRTFCKCVKREQPTLCDCIEKGRVPTKKGSITSKDLYVTTIPKEEGDTITKKSGEISKSKSSDQKLSHDTDIEKTESSMSPKVNRSASNEPIKELISTKSIKKTLLELQSDSVASALKSTKDKTKAYSDTLLPSPLQSSPASREAGRRSLPVVITPTHVSISSQPTSNEKSVKSLSEKESSTVSEINGRGSHFSKEDVHKISHGGTASGTVRADIDVEGNVPVEAEIELLPKSSEEGVYVTTTVTNSGQIEVTTEGPTGVVETTLQVTKSGNLEVVTGVTEYNQLSAGSIKQTKSGHPKKRSEIDLFNTKLKQKQACIQGFFNHGTEHRSETHYGCLAHLLTLNFTASSM